MNRNPSFVAAIAAAVLLVGCGAAAEKAGEEAAERLVEEQTGGSVDIDADGDGDGSVEIETEDGSASFGTGEVPEGWPEVLELPEDLEVQSGATVDSAEGLVVSVVGLTDETPEELLARYTEALAGWEIYGESTSTGGGATLTSAQWDTDDARVTFAANRTEADGRTFLTLGHTTLA